MNLDPLPLVNPSQNPDVLFWLQHSASFLSKATEPELRTAFWRVRGKFLECQEFGDYP